MFISLSDLNIFSLESRNIFYILIKTLGWIVIFEKIFSWNCDIRVISRKFWELNQETCSQFKNCFLSVQSPSYNRSFSDLLHFLINTQTSLTNLGSLFYDRLSTLLIMHLPTSNRYSSARAPACIIIMMYCAITTGLNCIVRCYRNNELELSFSFGQLRLTRESLKNAYYLTRVTPNLSFRCLLL